jgi:hypothetical protein
MMLLLRYYLAKRILIIADVGGADFFLFVVVSGGEIGQSIKRLSRRI